MAITAINKELYSFTVNIEKISQKEVEELDTYKEMIVAERLAIY